MQKNNKTAFLNKRDWGSYVGALQNAATCPILKDAFKSSRVWFTQGAAQASNWIAGRLPLEDGFSTG